MRQFNSQKVPVPPQKPHLAEWQGYSSLNLEVGSGTGMFAEQFCLNHPSRALIAIEKTFSRSKHLLQKNQPNLFCYHSDVVAFVTHYILDESLDEIFLLYPNPYPKKKQHNLRWHNRPFMNLLLQKLKPGGRLTMATNIQEYAEDAKKKYQEYWKLNLVSESLLGSNFLPRTLFEKKYLERAEPCWNLVFEKN